MAVDPLQKNVSVFDTLQQLGLASLETQSVFAPRTRDKEGLTVYRDTVSGVVYINDYYVGDETYEGAEHRKDDFYKRIDWDYEYQQDQYRRLDAYKQFYTGKTVTEFGCWKGLFLREAASRGADVTGIELHRGYIEALVADGYRCVDNPDQIAPATQDAVFAFHVLEHLPDPLSTLRDLRALLTDTGTLVVEVPHASDFLLSNLQNEAFKNFTLWSQHLILHTRESLRRLLVAAGYADVVIEGVQRYPLSNHLGWLANGKPGGHKSSLSALETPELRSAYEAALRKIDATDTLVAIARKAR